MVKRFEEMLWDELSESFLQGQELGFDAAHEPPVHIKSGGETQQRSTHYLRGGDPIAQGYITPSVIVGRV